MTEGMHLQNDWRSNEHNVGNKMKLTGSQGIQHLDLGFFIIVHNFTELSSLRLGQDSLEHYVYSTFTMCFVHHLHQLKMWMYQHQRIQRLN